MKVIDIKRPTLDEFLDHIKTGIKKKCIVCNNILFVSYTEYNGQARCLTCGVTYQVLGSHFKKDWLKEVGLLPKDIANRYCDIYYTIPVLKYYWKKYKKKLPYGIYLTTRKPWTADEHESFYRFLYDNNKYLSKEFEEDWAWEQVILHYEKGEVQEGEA